MKRLRANEGFTLIEVMIAALILLIAAGAVLKALSTAARGTERAKETQVALDVAQQQMEKIRALPYDQIALTSLPADDPTDTKNPDYRVSGSGGFFALNRDGTNTAKLVVNGGDLFGSTTPIAGGTVNPGSSLSATTSVGDVVLRIYRFVVWQKDPKCTTCIGDQDYKRVVIAVRIVKVANSKVDRGYVELQSNFIDPSKTLATIPQGGTGGVITAQQFWLSDTACSSGAVTTRIPPSADHNMHNTLGACASGLHTGGTVGAPDTLITSPPPDATPDDPALPVLADYALDYEPSPPSVDGGVQLQRPSVTGCAYTQAVGTTSPESKVHRWVTDKMTSAFTMSGKVTLEFYTRAINNATHSGKLCIFLVIPSETVGAAPIAQFVDATATTNSFFSYSASVWPNTAWTKVRVPLTIYQAPKTIAVGQRLGLAIAVEQAGTNAGAIQIAYDNPTYPSRLEVETTTPIEGG